MGFFAAPNVHQKGQKQLLEILPLAGHFIEGEK